jgi:MFS family permease
VRVVTGYRDLARNRDFTVLWAGETINELGSAVSLFAYPLLTYALTHSAYLTSVVEALFLLGMAGATLPGGVLADRVDRRRIMRTASGLSTLLYAALAALTLTGHLIVAELAVGALLTGIAAGVYGPAQTSAIRSVVSTDELSTALAQDQARQHVGSLLGGPLGGALYAVSRGLPFLTDAVSYLISTITVSRIRTTLAAPERTERTRIRRDLAEGFAFAWRWRFFRVLISWSSLTNMVGNAVFFVALLRMIQDHQPPAAIGAVSTAAGVGGLIGAAIAPRLIEALPTGVLTLVVAWMCVLPVAPLIWWSSPWAVGSSVFFLLLINPSGNAGISAYRMAMTTDHLQARASAASRFVSMALMPLSPVVGAALLHHYGGSTAVLVLVVASAALAIYLSASRSIRSVPRPAVWRAQLAEEVTPASRGSAAGSARSVSRGR